MTPSTLATAISGLLLCSCFSTATAQSFQPKSIQFKGDDEYTNAELMSAADLKKGAVLSSTEMGAHSKLLMDSGVFENLKYSFDGQDLIYQLIPSKDLYPIQLENFPFPAGTDLDAKLHAQLPLYHSKVPLEGTLLDSVCDQFKQQLAAKGIQATITTAPFVNLKTGKTTAITLTISSPAVLVGDIHIDGASPAQSAKATAIAAKYKGSPYNNPGSQSQLETDMRNLYTEQGYLQAASRAELSLTPIVDADGVHIPFTINIIEGPMFHLEGVFLAPDLAVTQQAFDKQALVHPGEVAMPEKLRAEWQFLGRQYHNKGNLKAVITPKPTYNATQATVRYDVIAESGPVYNMGSLNVERVSDDLRQMIIAAWPMKPGTPYNEGAIRGMMASHGVNPTLEKLFANYELRYKLTLHDDTHLVDVIVSFERRP